MTERNSIFPNHQANSQDVAGIYYKIDSNLLNLIRKDQIHPKPLILCGGGTSSRCAYKNHWTLDMRKNYQDINFNTQSNEILIQSGINMKKLSNKLLESNRFFPIGLSGLTGIGYILTGGISPLSRKYGLAIDQLLEINGIWGSGESFKLFRPISLNKTEDKLKWKALSGAAPFLAIVTSLKLKTYKLKTFYAWETSLTPKQLAETLVMAEDWPNCASFYWNWGNTLKSYGLYELDDDDDDTNYTKLKKIINKIPKSHDFKIFNSASFNEILEAISPINKNNSLIHSEVVGLLGPELNGKAVKVVKEIEKLINIRPTNECYISAQQLGGETKKNNLDLTSFIHRDSIWKPWITGSWNAGNDLQRKKSLSWMNISWDLLSSYFPGVHLAQMHPHLEWHDKEMNAAFQDWLPELKQLKLKYDPKGILPPL